MRQMFARAVRPFMEQARRPMRECLLIQALTGHPTRDARGVPWRTTEHRSPAQPDLPSDERGEHAGRELKICFEATCGALEP